MCLTRPPPSRPRDPLITKQRPPLINHNSAYSCIFQQRLLSHLRTFGKTLHHRMRFMNAGRLAGVPVRVARLPAGLGPFAPRRSRLGALSAAEESPTTLTFGKVSFHVVRHVDFGQSLTLVGAPPQLGTWDIAEGVKLEWEEGDVWSCQTELPPGELEYKYVVGDSDGMLVEWYPGENLTTVVAPNETIEVSDEWIVEVPAEDEVLEASDGEAVEVAGEVVEGVGGDDSEPAPLAGEVNESAMQEAQVMETSILQTAETSEPNGHALEVSPAAANGSVDQNDDDASDVEDTSTSDGDKQVEIVS